MAPRVLALLMMFLAVIASAVPAAAQSPMPYDEYRQQLDAAREAERQASESEPSVSTVEEYVARFTAALDRREDWLTLLESITPDPCYAEAHAEYLAYARDVLAIYRETLPLIKDAETPMGMVPALLTADEAVRAAHPLAYIEDASAQSGYRNEPMNIFEVLSTCPPLASETPEVVVSPKTPRGSSAPAGAVFTDAGNGTKATAPFELAAGDHELAYEVSASGSFCSFGFALRATDDSYSSSMGANGAYVYDTSSPYRNTTWFSVPAAGRFYLDVSGDCGWTAELSTVPSPLDGADVITLTGSGLGLSPAFTLEGGDFVVRYHLTSPISEEMCRVYADGIINPSSPYSDLGGDIQLTMDASSELDGETYVYGIEPGRYQYQVGNAWCQFGVPEPVTWEITIEPVE